MTQKFEKIWLCFLSYLMTLEAIIKQLAPLLSCWQLKNYKKFKKSNTFFKKFTTFSILFNDRWGNGNAISDVINALIIQ